MGGFNFSKWLAQKLDEKDITRRELAKKVGITEVSMSRYYNGKRIPTVDVAMDIAIALGQDGLKIEEETEKKKILSAVRSAVRPQCYDSVSEHPRKLRRMCRNCFGWNALTPKDVVQKPVVSTPKRKR